MKETAIIAISGVKNSGKTTLIEKLIPEFNKQGIRTAVIKHDGHDFEADVPGTDSYRIRKAGAYGTAVFSDTKYLLVKDAPEKGQEKRAEYLASLFPEADLILLEGFKNSKYPKLEVIRKGNSEKSVCRGNNLLALISDFQPENPEEVPVFGLEDVGEIVSFLKPKLFKEAENEVSGVSCKIMLSEDEFFFGPGVFHLLQKIQETGSIRSAAMDFGLSYPKACKLINRAEKGSGLKLLERTIGGKNGGKSILTQDGEDYLDKYQRLLQESQKAVRNLYRDIFMDN